MVISVETYHNITEESRGKKGDEYIRHLMKEVERYIDTEINMKYRTQYSYSINVPPHYEDLVTKALRKVGEKYENVGWKVNRSLVAQHPGILFTLSIHCSQLK